MSRIDWTAQPLGKMTDVALAQALGVTTATVTHARRKLGIPGLRLIKDDHRLAGPNRGEIDWDKQPLGQLPDLELAKILGTHRARVRLARIRRGIPLFAESDMFGKAQGDHNRELERYREGRWYGFPVTADKCRYCREARNKRSLKGPLEAMARSSDQGPCCARHYVALPSCAKCLAPVTSEGDLCESCLTVAIRAERESAGWRREVYHGLPSVDRGDVETIRRGIRTFEHKHGITTNERGAH